MAFPVWPFAINRNSIQALGLVAWMPPTLGLGNRILNLRSNASLLGANHARLAPDPATGAALVCDGTDDYADIAAVDLGLNGGKRLSVAAWCKLGPAQSTSGSIISKHIHYVPDQTFSTFFVIVNASNRFVCSVQSPTGWAYPTWTTTAAALVGVWHHVCFVFRALNGNATDMRLYINGIAATTNYVANYYNSSFLLTETRHNLVMGARFYASYTGFFNGSIGDCRVYNRTLSDAEVAALWHPATRWDLYYRPSRRYFCMSQGMVFNPTWAERTNRLIGGG